MPVKQTTFETFSEGDKRKIEQRSAGQGNITRHYPLVEESINSTRMLVASDPITWKQFERFEAEAEA